MTEMIGRLHQFVSNQALDNVTLTWLSIAYTVLIILGATGNGLVCIVVARKPSMRTPRNVFIINLAISDLILCLITMPLTLVEIAYKYWPLGEIACKLLNGLMATSIFVSTLSITAIALDRYKVIVNPVMGSSQSKNVTIKIIFIWIIAFVLSTPLFIYRRIERYNLKDIELLRNLQTVEYCSENWPIEHGRALYSILSMVFQYLMPVVIVSVAYKRILRKLKDRFIIRKSNTQSQVKQRYEKRKNRKTKLLLISISFIFGISWFPLNIFNIIADMYSFSDDKKFITVLFAACHLIGMSSACSNPLLYGFLNDNFRRDFKEIFRCFCPFTTVEPQTQITNSVADERMNSVVMTQLNKQTVIN